MKLVTSKITFDELFLGGDIYTKAKVNNGETSNKWRYVTNDKYAFFTDGRNINKVLPKYKESFKLEEKKAVEYFTKIRAASPRSIMAKRGVKIAELDNKYYLLDRDFNEITKEEYTFVLNVLKGNKFPTLTTPNGSKIYEENIKLLRKQYLKPLNKRLSVVVAADGSNRITYSPHVDTAATEDFNLAGVGCKIFSKLKVEPSHQAFREECKKVYPCGNEMEGYEGNKGDLVCARSWYNHSYDGDLNDRGDWD